MPVYRWTIAAGCLMAFASGCRLPVWEGPISRSLATSRSLSQQGVSAMEYGQMDRAEKLLGQAVKACPADCEARRHYAEALWRQGNREGAIHQLEVTDRRGEEDATLQVTLAQMRLAVGRKEEARAAIQRAIDLDPKLSAAWAVRGQIARMEDRPQDALAHYQRAAGLAPDDRDVRMAVAELYLQMQEPQRALVTLQSLHDSYPPGEEPAALLCFEGVTQTLLGRFDEATELLVQAASREPSDPEILFRLGEAQLLAGRFDQASDSARRALELNPEHRASVELLHQVEVACGQAPLQR